MWGSSNGPDPIPNPNINANTNPNPNERCEALETTVKSLKTDASGFKIAKEETETKIDSYIQKVASLEEDLSHMQVLKSQLTETKGALITCQQELSAAL